MEFIKSLEKEITSYFKTKPEMEVIHCPILGVDTVTIKFVNDAHAYCQEIGVQVTESFDFTSYLVEVYVLEVGSYTFYPVKELKHQYASECSQVGIIKTVLRLMRDDSFFESLKK